MASETSVVRGTTPTFELILDDETVDLTQATNVYASFKQVNKQVDKNGEGVIIYPHQVDVYLTQLDTLQFDAGELEVQLNWTYANGERASSDTITIDVEKNLIGRVLE